MNNVLVVPHDDDLSSDNRRRHRRQLMLYKRIENQAAIQDDLWYGAHAAFGVNRTQATETRHYLIHHLASIARDNLAGQCTKGHSCKSSTRAILERLMKTQQQHPQQQQSK